jgi:hypothetical protein
MIFPPGSVITLVADENVTLTMNQVADSWVLLNSGETIIPVEGISDGAGTVNGLTLEFENSNTGLFSNVNVSAIGTDGKATFSFTPASGQVGTAQIRLSVSNTIGAKRQVIFYVFVMSPFGVNELDHEHYRIYPNPTSEKLNVEFAPDQFKEFAVTDITGRLMLQQVISSDHFSINVSSWNKGIYVIKMTGDNNSRVGRFIIE